MDEKLKKENAKRQRLKEEMKHMNVRYMETLCAKIEEITVAKDNLYKQKRVSSQLFEVNKHRNT